MTTPTQQVGTPCVPKVATTLPRANGKQVLEKDARYMSPSYSRCYPLVISRAQGMTIRFCPSLIATEREVDMAVGILGGAMDSVAARAA